MVKPLLANFNSDLSSFSIQFLVKGYFTKEKFEEIQNSWQAKEQRSTRSAIKSGGSLTRAEASPCQDVESSSPWNDGKNVKSFKHRYFKKSVFFRQYKIDKALQNHLMMAERNISRWSLLWPLKHCSLILHGYNVPSIW